MKGFVNKSAFENHNCDDNMKKKQVNSKDSTRLLKDLAH